MNKFRLVDYRNVDFTSGIWKQAQELNAKTTIYSVRDRFRDTYRFEALNCDWTPDKPYKPHIFWDSDIAKWVESAAYIIAKTPDPELESNIEDVIDVIEKHQQSDGYFNIYYTAVEPGKRFTVRNNHELYCAGHLIEAAVAYYEATGKDRFLKLMEKYVDLIYQIFFVEKSAAFRTPGHEELELALMRLYRCTGNKKYLELSSYFIDTRGTPEDHTENNPDFMPCEIQADVPVREQQVAVGHAVREGYLFCGAADNAAERGDSELWTACRRIFNNITQKQMYITGGVGSMREREVYTKDFDLPNKTAYAETCAAISLAFFAQKMLLTEIDSEFSDTVERTLYNGIMSGLSLDGKKFFYENPLEMTYYDRERSLSSPPAKRERWNIPERVEVFRCSCCPPNVTRFVASLGGYCYGSGENEIFVHQYISSEADIDGAKLSLATDYPESGLVEISLTGAKGKSVAVRIPGWCGKYDVSRNGKPLGGELKNGYFYIGCDSDSMNIELNFDIKPVLMEANTMVMADAGRVALMRGPVVYCAEAVDNGERLDNVRIQVPLRAAEGFDKELGMRVITVDAMRRESLDDRLYAEVGASDETPIALRMIPFRAFANRGPSEMAVWFRR